MQRAFEKIVEELEVEKTIAYNTYKNYEMKVDLGRAFGAEKAIEIVNQVASEYGEEVCEWKFVKSVVDGGYIFSSGCNHKRFSDLHSFVYCPYCGKKIKVVE